MKKQLLTEMGLKTLGFSELIGDKLDDGGYYRWWKFSKNDSDIIVTYEYDSKNKFITGHIEFNGSTLQGREITIKDLTLLIELM